MSGTVTRFYNRISIPDEGFGTAEALNKILGSFDEIPRPKIDFQPWQINLGDYPMTIAKKM